ncbi:hypothetical protein NSQ77_03225 [Oceanobacillus sp. FSL K6-2867]|uniref:hypothetical protein n=1 Tax=Oceanobacillus sp. FSL K6-2867 TaxID=2954748 RepID=UPI0030DD3D27
MSIFVMDCNEWITYHIADMLLENGYHVNALEASDNEEDLSMFFIRNSSFSMISGDVQKKFNTGIFVRDLASDILHDFEQLIVINPAKNADYLEGHKRCTAIYTPILFGEWMPMKEEGIFDQGKFIPFASEAFKKNALYIGDFSKALLQWLQISDLPRVLYVNHHDKGKSDDSKLEKNVFIRENIPKHKRVKAVIEHYRSKRNFMI